MKTFFQTYDQKQAQQKVKEYSLKYSCPFTFYCVRAGFMIVPNIDNTIKPDSKNSDMVLSVLNNTGIGFLSISEKTDLTILETLEACQYLIKNRIVTCDVGRSGKIVGIHIYKL